LSGFTLIELLCAMGLLAVLAAFAVPQVLTNIDRSRTHSAARYLASRMSLARTQAVARGATVAVRFAAHRGDVTFRAYVDGNGNGVRTREIVSGVDPPIDAPAQLPDLFPGVRFAL
jgi:type IV fimbrial biogenesis protein FimT